MSDIHARVQNELVASGAYGAIYATLERELANAGWTDNFQGLAQRAMENAAPEELHFGALLDRLGPEGRASVPEEVKARVLKQIAEFLDTVVE